MGVSGADAHTLDTALVNAPTGFLRNTSVTIALAEVVCDGRSHASPPAVAAVLTAFGIDDDDSLPSAVLGCGSRESFEILFSSLISQLFFHYSLKISTPSHREPVVKNKGE